MWLAQHYLGRYIASGQRDATALRLMKHYGVHPEAKLFEHPYYWAGSMFTGVYATSWRVRRVPCP
jgi:hypothetical protein